MKRVACATVMMTATLGVAACTDYESATNLNPEGPPMITQVRMRENYTAPNSTIVSTRRVFAFGSHAMATETEAHPVTSATAMNNSLRIIVDELLVGNNLEEIACRSDVDGDAYARVPRGATPDDIAKCASAQDVLPATCKGEFAVCMCENAAGCLVDNDMIAQGAPVGVLDINQDGAADDTRMIAGVVGMRCGTIDVPIDLDMSYWNPSGNQQVPAMGGFDALGPAIVLVPQRGMPTNLECQLTFAPDVVDKQGEGVCAPAGGDIASGCAVGDLTAFKWKVEPLDYEPATFLPNGTGVSRTDPVIILSTVPLDTATIQATTITPAPAGTVTKSLDMGNKLTLTFGAPGLAANTMYTITIPTSVKDTFGQGAPQVKTFSFTTGT